MSTLNEQTLTEALKAVVDPNTGRDFVSTRQLKNLRVEGGDVAFDVELGYPAKSQIAGLRKALIAAARGVPGVENVPRNCPVGAHQANGEIESGVRELRRQMGAVRMALERRLGRKQPAQLLAIIYMFITLTRIIIIVIRIVTII